MTEPLLTSAAMDTREWQCGLGNTHSSKSFAGRVGSGKVHSWVDSILFPLKTLTVIGLFMGCTFVDHHRWQHCAVAEAPVSAIAEG